MTITLLSSDNKSGASEILSKAVELLTEKLQSFPHDDADRIRPELESFGLQIIKSQPQMAPLFNLVNSTLIRFEEGGVDSVTRMLDEYDAVERRKQQEVAAALDSLITSDMTVFTYSRSRTLVQALCQISASKVFQVLVTEARPMVEGRTTARTFVDAGLHVTVAVDAAIHRLAKQADVFLCGADSFSSFNVVNKIGTSLFALAAAHNQKPLFAVTTMNKFVPESVKLAAEPMHDPAEVWENASDAITVWNQYFESVDLDMFSGIITENGRVSQSDLQLYSRSVEIHPFLMRHFGE